MQNFVSVNYQVGTLLTLEYIVLCRKYFLSLLGLASVAYFKFPL